MVGVPADVGEGGRMAATADGDRGVNDIVYCAWCAICGALVTTPKEWENHKHEDEALTLEEVEYDNPHFPIHTYREEQPR